jgi:hypothetical protein
MVFPPCCSHFTESPERVHPIKSTPELNMKYLFFITILSVLLSFLATPAQDAVVLLPVSCTSSSKTLDSSWMTALTSTFCLQHVETSVSCRGTSVITQPSPGAIVESVCLQVIDCGFEAAILIGVLLYFTLFLIVENYYLSKRSKRKPPKWKTTPIRLKSCLRVHHDVQPIRLKSCLRVPRVHQQPKRPPSQPLRNVSTALSRNVSTILSGSNVSTDLSRNVSTILSGSDVATALSRNISTAESRNDVSTALSSNISTALLRNASTRRIRFDQVCQVREYKCALGHCVHSAVSHTGRRKRFPLTLGNPVRDYFKLCNENHRSGKYEPPEFLTENQRFQRLWSFLGVFGFFRFVLASFYTEPPKSRDSEEEEADVAMYLAALDAKNVETDQCWVFLNRQTYRRHSLKAVQTLWDLQYNNSNAQRRVQFYPARTVREHCPDLGHLVHAVGSGPDRIFFPLTLGWERCGSDYKELVVHPDRNAAQGISELDIEHRVGRLFHFGFTAADLNAVVKFQDTPKDTRPSFEVSQVKEDHRILCYNERKRYLFWDHCLNPRLSLWSQKEKHVARKLREINSFWRRKYDVSFNTNYGAIHVVAACDDGVGLPPDPFTKPVALPSTILPPLSDGIPTPIPFARPVALPSTILPPLPNGIPMPIPFAKPVALPSTTRPPLAGPMSTPIAKPFALPSTILSPLPESMPTPIAKPVALPSTILPPLPESKSTPIAEPDYLPDSVDDHIPDPNPFDLVPEDPPDPVNTPPDLVSEDPPDPVNTPPDLVPEDPADPVNNPPDLVPEDPPDPVNNPPDLVPEDPPDPVNNLPDLVPEDPPDIVLNPPPILQRRSLPLRRSSCITTPLRRSARLAMMPRVSYIGMC